MLSWVPMLAKGGDPAWLFLMLLGGLVIAVLAILSNAHTEEQRRALALRLGGRYEPNGFFSNPTLHFRVADRPALLEFQGGRGASTRFSVSLPASAPGRFKVTNVQFGWGMLRLLGYNSVLTGDAAFDALFAVTGDRGFIQRVFDPETRSRSMGAVRRLGVYPGFTLEFETRSLQIHFSGTIDEEAFVRALRRSAKELVAVVFGPPAVAGIVWGESAERPSGLCPICTTVLREPMIRCPRCRAPHHRECWDYLGRCAVYGCEPKPGRRAA